MATNSKLELKDGSRIAVVGAGPAGSLFGYFLLNLAGNLDMKLDVDIYESRDFPTPGPVGCNMCAGVISESLVQNLSLEGINLPPTVVQRGIDSYVMHSETDTMIIKTPINEMRIATVHRGSGPRGLKEVNWQSFDEHLLKLALNKGAKHVQERVKDITWQDDRPQVEVKDKEPQVYDLVVGALGVNSPALSIFEKLVDKYRRPATRKAFITELPFGREAISGELGNSMHVFLLKFPGLDFAAFVPKGDFITLCLIGEGINNELKEAFTAHPALEGILPGEGVGIASQCHCSPNASLGDAVHPFGDRVVLIGDCGIARLNKDGIGSAYRTAKVAATAAIFEGISSDNFQQHYWPICKSIINDNGYGRFIFAIVNLMKKWQFLVRGALLMATKEQSKSANKRVMSSVLWDMFTGSAPYKEVFMRTISPSFIIGYVWNIFLGFLPRKKIKVGQGG